MKTFLKTFAILFIAFFTAKFLFTVSTAFAMLVIIAALVAYIRRPTYVQVK